MNSARTFTINLWFFKALLLLGLCVFMGCKKKPKQPKEDTVVKAYRLIDEQRTSEAIDLLEEELKKDSSIHNNEIKFVLASAYAHNAGIKIQVLVPAVTQLYKFQNATKKKKLAQQYSASGKPVNKIAVTVSAMFNQISATLETYAAIPGVTEAQVDFLKHAIELINSIEAPVTQEQALYRAVLKIILFKYMMEESLLTAPASIDVAIVEDKNCVINIKKLNESLVPLGKLLITIFNDMAIANPRHSESLTKTSTEINTQLAEMALASNTFSVMDEFSASLIKRSALELGLGKMIKCQEN